MKKILIFQHSNFEPLGIIIPLLRQYKVRCRYLNFQRNPHKDIKIQSYQGIIVLGGPMHPTQTQAYPHLLTEIDYLKQALDLHIPVLGICLGAQLLAMALGGRCYAMKKAEIGWHPVQFVKPHSNQPYFSHFLLKEVFFQWHSCSFELPQPIDRLAYSEGKIIQAFHHNNLQFGLQFHPEVNTDLLKRWLNHPQYLEQIHKHLTTSEIASIKNDNLRYIQRSQKIANQFLTSLFDSFLQPIRGNRLNTMHAGG